MTDSHSHPLPPCAVTHCLHAGKLAEGSYALPEPLPRVAYEVIRVHRGRPLFLRLHLERLERSARELGIPLAREAAWLPALRKLMAMQTGTQNCLVQSFVEAGRGESLPYARFVESHYPSPVQYEQGVRMAILHAERPNPHVKQQGLNTREEADRMLRDEPTLYEVMLVNRAGEITEGSRSSLLFLRDGELHTAPAEQVLLGTTRRVILEEAERLGIPVHERAIPLSELPSFQGVAILGSSPQLLEVREVGDTRFAVGHAPFALLLEAYQERAISD